MFVQQALVIHCFSTDYASCFFVIEHQLMFSAQSYRTESTPWLTVGYRGGLWHISFNICPLGPLRGKRQEAGAFCPGKSDQCDCNRSFVKIRAVKSNKGLDTHTQAHCEFFSWQDRWLLWQRTYKQKDRELSAPPWEQQSRVNRTCTASDSISCSGLWEHLWRGCYRVVDALTEALLEGSGYGVCCGDKLAAEDRQTYWGREESFKFQLPRDWMDKLKYDSLPCPRIKFRIFCLLRDLGSTLSRLQVLWMPRCSLQGLEGISTFSSLKVEFIEDRILHEDTTQQPR